MGIDYWSAAVLKHPVVHFMGCGAPHEINKKYKYFNITYVEMIIFNQYTF